MLGFPDGSNGKESACSAEDSGSIPGLERSHGERNGNPLQCSCLENSMDRGAWLATVQRVTKSDTTEQLTHIYTPPRPAPPLLPNPVSSFKRGRDLELDLISAT